MRKRKVCIIYTGGTIGMVPSESGFVPKQGTFSAELEAIRDLYSDEMPDWDLVEFDPLLDSSNIRYEQWNLIAETIADRYDAYDGFVVLHGTDTMAYTASALSFMLEGLDKPVVLTGSQIPLCELRSDGRDNLITSMMIAAEGVVREVVLYFCNSLLRGNRSVKQSSDGLIAFASPNCPELARAGVYLEYNRKLLREPDQNEGGLRICRMNSAGIAVIKIVPGMQLGLFGPVISGGLDGLVLEAFGTGNIPDYDETLKSLIAEAEENGTAVVVITQCPQGTVHLGVYETGAALVRAGVINGFNMTTEAAVTKLQYLLSRGLSGDELRNNMEKDLRGELSN